MNIFLTGGTGSIGSAVLGQAVAAGHIVTALARTDASASALSDAGATALRGEISAPDDWMPAAVNADGFIHLASSFDDAMAVTESALLRSLIAHAAPRAKPLRFLYTGGCWLYGQTGSAVATETSPLRPIAAFDWACKAVDVIEKHPSLSCAILHPAMVYDESGGVFARMITALRAGRPAPIWGSENTRWPLVHREDVARAYLLLLQHDARGAFNVVAERGVPVGEIAKTLSDQAGNKTRPAVVPHNWVLSRHGDWAEGPMLDQQMASTRMEGLGWSPQHSDYAALSYQF